MNVTSIEFTANIKKSVLEDVIKKIDIIEEFDIEELDKNDGMKDIIISFSNPINIKYLTEALKPLIDVSQSIELKD
ncbi:MAG: hypothetical protein K0B02_00585 [DPANN group archaeon]|nr:hypothetical protein [DPANN group archaeon]